MDYDDQMIFIKELDGDPDRPRCLEVFIRSDTIAHVKSRLTNASKFPLDQLRLTFAGRLLEDERTLSYYNIRDNDTVEVVVFL